MNRRAVITVEWEDDSAETVDWAYHLRMGGIDVDRVDVLPPHVKDGPCWCVTSADIARLDAYEEGKAHGMGLSLLDYRADPEDCPACGITDGPCPYHQGHYDGWNVCQELIRVVLMDPEAVIRQEGYTAVHSELMRDRLG